jgi:alpha-L-fucosidase 2
VQRFREMTRPPAERFSSHGLLSDLASGLIGLARAALGLGFAAAAMVASQPAPPILWYGQPARQWTEALPIGNGHLGAMVFGGTADERIQFNESTLWTGHPHNYVRAGAREALPEIRRLLFAGETAAAQKLAREKFIGDPDRQTAYQPFGDLRFHFSGHEAATGYRREVDLDRAVATVTYLIGKTRFRRDVFASFPAGLLVVTLTADRPGQLSFSLAVTSPHRSARTLSVGADMLALAGEVESGGLRFESRTRAIVTGGRQFNERGTLNIEGADSVTILVSAATNYRNYEDISADPAAGCDAALARVAGRQAGELLSAHVADHRMLFRRSALTLGSAERDRLPTDARLAEIKRNGLESDPALAALYFAYGRYLLIASSRPGGQPANLQGIWNQELAPPWDSKWTTNINLEMNYWPAEVTNLAECHAPLFDLIDDLAVSGARTAREQYGAGGWVLHHNTDLWRATAPVNGLDGIWPTGGAWLCYHLWEHWRFSGDRTFLAQRAYPAHEVRGVVFRRHAGTGSQDRLACDLSGLLARAG